MSFTFILHHLLPVVKVSPRRSSISAAGTADIAAVDATAGVCISHSCTAGDLQYEDLSRVSWMVSEVQCRARYPSRCENGLYAVAAPAVLMRASCSTYYEAT